MKHFILNGWPTERADVPEEIREYFEYNNELGIHGDIILRGERIIIPKLMRKNILHKIHDGHIGIEGCTKRARESMFWPGMTSDIK